MRKIIDGGGSMLVGTTKTRDEAQAYLNRKEPIPDGYYVIDRPLILRVAKLPSGHRWASKGTVLVGVPGIKCVVRVLGAGRATKGAKCD